MDIGDPRAKVKELLQAGDMHRLLRSAASVHGHYCPGLAYGVSAGYAGLKRLGFENTGMEELLAVVECNNCFVDGIQVTTGCTFGNNSLIYKDLGKTAVTILSRRMKAALRLVLRPGRWESEKATETEKEAADLFRRVVTERQDDPEASKRLHEVWQELSFETVTKPEEELFSITNVPAVFPEYAPMVASPRCSECGEQFMETKAATGGEQPLCLTCAGSDVLGVLGGGIRALTGGKY